MELTDILVLVTKIGFGSIATLLAIMLWSKTRDSAWMFVVVATILTYGEVIFSALESFGIVSYDLLVIMGVPAARIIFAAFPLLFYIIAFLIMLIRKKGR